MNISLSLATALIIASASVSCFADTALSDVSDVSNVSDVSGVSNVSDVSGVSTSDTLTAPTLTKAERRAAREAHCSESLNLRLDELQSTSLAKNPQWNANQRGQLDDAITTARRTPWAQLDSETMLSERLSAVIRPRDERARAAIVAEDGQQARRLYPSLISKTEMNRASEAAQSVRALWIAQSKADASALYYSTCLRDSTGH